MLFEALPAKLYDQRLTSENCPLYLQADELKEIFEEVNGLKDCLQRCVTDKKQLFGALPAMLYDQHLAFEKRPLYLQANELKEIFEEVNGLKDCLQRCVTGMGGAFKKSHISRQLKAMGLKRNRLTDS